MKPNVLTSAFPDSSFNLDPSSLSAILDPFKRTPGLSNGRGCISSRDLLDRSDSLGQDGDRRWRWRRLDAEVLASTR